ncbi:methyltetrahydroprotoberberine 14-monooxygenase-like [Hibiscus syriacus]|uniref:methyltetrahydroprotoberberine 14-monooxygenase-like n=1 Tax=Hibiscus syriacus TaxID=106335 RepID=UPI00192128F3|nr:methyltetrahydroprotoberberine 14-monooxygenase-like [Hibiscus syriacus]
MAMDFFTLLQQKIVFTLLVPLLIVIFIFGDINRAKSNKKDNKKSPPELVGGSPFLNHLHLFEKGKLVHRKLESLADKYGPAFFIHMGIHPTLPRSLTMNIMGYNQALMGSTPHDPYWSYLRKIATVKLLSNQQLKLLKYVREMVTGNGYDGLNGKNDEESKRCQMVTIWLPRKPWKRRCI